jgi:Uroporphyrinogen decarboxylase (URO-D)
MSELVPDGSVPRSKDGERARIIGVISPNWVHTATGVRFDERYFMDPEYRQSENRRIGEWLDDFNQSLRRRFLRHDVDWEPIGISGIDGMYDPRGLSAITVGLPQPFVVVTAMFGGRIEYFDGDNPDSSGYPLAGIESVSEIAIPDFENTWPVSEWLRQYDELVAKYGKSNVELQFLYLHSPLTIAYRLRGEQLFLDMVDSPELAERIIDAAHATALGIYQLYERRVGKPKPTLPIATCIASLVSSSVFRRWELPWLRRLMDQYPSALIHTCGPSSHVLEPLAELTGVVTMEVGAGTDIARTRELFPDATINYVIDTPKFVHHTATQVTDEIRAVVAQNGRGPLSIIWPAETGTPIETIEAIYVVISEHNRSLAKR